MECSQKREKETLKRKTSCDELKHHHPDRPDVLFVDEIRDWEARSQREEEEETNAFVMVRNRAKEELRCSVIARSDVKSL